MSKSPPSKHANYVEELGQETIDALLLANEIPDSIKNSIFDDTISSTDRKLMVKKTNLINKIEKMILRKKKLKDHGFSINHQVIDFSCEAIVNAGNKKINADKFGSVGGISRAIHDFFTIDESPRNKESPLASLLEIEAMKNLQRYSRDEDGGIYLEDGKAMILSLDAGSADLDQRQKSLLAKKKPTVDFAGCKYLIHAVGPDCKDSEYEINTSDDIFNQKIKKTKRKKALYLAYKNSLTLAHKKGCRSIHLPFISIGIFNYPKKEFAKVVAKALFDFKNEKPGAFAEGIKISVRDPTNPHTINGAIELLEKELLELYQKQERITKSSQIPQSFKPKSSLSLKRASVFLLEGKRLNTFLPQENTSKTSSKFKQINLSKSSSSIPTDLVVIGKLADSFVSKKNQFRDNPRVAMAIERSDTDVANISNVAKLIFQRQYDIAKDTANRCYDYLKSELSIFQELQKGEGENDQQFNERLSYTRKKNFALLEDLLELAQSVAKENEGISRQGKSESAKAIISQKLAIKPLVLNGKELDVQKAFEIIAKLSVEFQKQASNKRTFSGNFQADNYQQVGFSLKRVDKECFVRGFMDGVNDILSKGGDTRGAGARGR
ncbi:MAG: hypothetical protein RL769_380 [Pseudomonadota bacterium]|jgi:O-acetyl-ADP-ribose deacetylase (regulator of RNase III)